MRKEEFIKEKPTQSAYFAHSTRSVVSLYVVPVVVIVFSMFMATYDFAASINDVSMLGTPVYYFRDQPVYGPWMIIAWMIKFNFFSDHYELVSVYLTDSLRWILYGSIVAFVYMFFFRMMRGKRVRTRNVHGTSRWGENKDLKKHGLIAKTGLVFGQRKKAVIKAVATSRDVVLKTKKIDKLVMFNGNSSTMVVMPPRSGKGVSVIIPSLFSIEGSVIVLDLKEELYKTTSGYRSQFSHILKLSLTSRVSLGINPLMLIREETAWRDANMCASLLLAPRNEDSNESETAAHFRESAVDALTGFILHVLCSDYPDKSLGGVLDFVSSSGIIDVDENANLAEVEEKLHSSTYNLLLDMQRAEHVSYEIHSQIASVSGRLIEKESRERSGVFSTVLKALLLFQDPVIRANTSKHDIDFRMFIESENPISLYLTTPYSDLKRVSPILRLILTMSVSYFSEGSTQHGDEKMKNRLVYILDEFKSLGAFPLIQEGMAALPGYGITFMIVVQSIKQIIQSYGKDHSFFDLCKIICFSATGDYDTAKMFSDMIGQETIVKETVNNQLSVEKVGVSGASQGLSEQGRNLINPDEIMKYPHTDMIVLMQGMPPYRSKKVVYYDDRRFMKLSKFPYLESTEALEKEVPDFIKPDEWFHPPAWRYFDNENECLNLFFVRNENTEENQSPDDEVNDSEDSKRGKDTVGVSASTVDVGDF